MALSNIKIAEIIKLTAEDKATSEIAKIVGCGADQVRYIKKLNPQKEIILSVSVEGPKWDHCVGYYFLVRCQTERGRTITVCRAWTDENSKRQKARKKMLQKKFSEVLVGYEIEFCTRRQFGDRLEYIAKYAKLPDDLKDFIPNSYCRGSGRNYDPDDDMLLEGAFTDDERECFTRRERAEMIGR